MRVRSLVAAILSVGLQASAGSVARADDTAIDGPMIWAPYVAVDDTTIEIRNLADHATSPQIEITLRIAQARINCQVGLCTYRIQAPEIAPGDSWTLALSDWACSTGLNENRCLPDGTVGGARIDAALATGTGANAGGTTRDPDGDIAAVVTTDAGPYDAVVAAPEARLTDVARRLGSRDGASTAIRLMGEASVTIDWYRGNELVAEQSVGPGSYCCGETGYFHTGTASVDARDVDGLDDDATYTVVVTANSGGLVSAATTDAP